MKKALIIFVRNPEKGKVKTRLAATMGAEKALAIYIELLAHTRAITTAVHAAKFVYYADKIEQDDLWNGAAVVKKLQGNYDLGGKMKEAFSVLFEAGFEKVMIIGSDCLELSTLIIEQAFDLLDEKEVVIGPASDGGYYLLGMKKLLPAIFENKQWSTDVVLQQTIADIQKEHISYHELITLTDIDTEEDWIKTKTALL